jgi:uncharacterized membrane protein YfcA
MMVLATIGGWLGARWAKRLPMSYVRMLVLLTGVVMTTVFFVRQ